MRLDIVNGNIVTGDGETYLEDSSLIVQDGLIIDILRIRHIPYNFYTERFIDAKDGLIIPGLINIHAHCVSFGPILTYAHHPIPEERVILVESLNDPVRYQDIFSGPLIGFNLASPDFGSGWNIDNIKNMLAKRESMGFDTKIPFVSSGPNWGHKLFGDM